MLDRMHNAKATSDELKTFYNRVYFLVVLVDCCPSELQLIRLTVRAAIEDEYARKLLALCRKPLGGGEMGSLRASFDVVRGETESIGKAHAGIASQMKRELEEPLVAFGGGSKERRKIVQNGIERLLKSKIQQTQTVNKVSQGFISR